MGEAWYVARTKPLCEQVVATHLSAHAFEYFLPTFRAELPRRGRAGSLLFPGYVFVRCDPESPASTSLRTMPGLRGLVAFGGVAPAVPDDVVDALRRRLIEMNAGASVWRRYRAGDQVWVRWGARPDRLGEELAQVVEDAKSPQGRVRVLLSFLGHVARAEVPFKNVRPAVGGEAVRPSSHEQAHIEQAVAERTGVFRRRTRGRGRHLAWTRP